MEQETFSSDIAIIGMSGRFPGARTTREFWDNLSQGREAMVQFSDQQLQAEGVAPETFNDPNYVRMGSVIDDLEFFDANFFDISPHDAALMDPQHRFFLECAWEALEEAGYDTQRCDARIGVFAGAGMNTYLLANLSSHRELLEREGNFIIGLGNEKDYLATRTSYKLNLKGPSISIGTACSTSLVAVHLAAQSLQCHECDMALAGASALKVPHHTGYRYQEGGIASPDGHCRTFDAQAQGTIRGNGTGVVLLKRLDDAIADNDTILAVIKGTSINNDGSAKIGYTAPSVSGQAAVIREAQEMAGITPDMLSYIEAHGTGTQLGDPIEVTALTQVFSRATWRKGYCGLGSVKSNIGHLDVAAGIAGLIKVVLALKHKQIPPSLHFTEANPEIDFANSPFYVNTQLRTWESPDYPRTAGVSSFGIGGTNAHIVVQELSQEQRSEEQQTQQLLHLLPLSARTGNALEHMSGNLAAYLTHEKPHSMGDIAATLQLGRRQFAHRRVILCQGHEDAASALKRGDAKYIMDGAVAKEAPGIAFLFPGQGSQHINMAADVYRHEPVFRAQLDRCAEYALPELKLDVRQLMYPAPEDAARATEQLTQTAIAQPVIFMVAYALAQQWMAWGIKPACMLGHSIGEYVAACLAGVFSLEDALHLTIIRGRMIQQLPVGSMLAVPLPPEDVTRRLKAHPHLSLATVNTAERCVVAGPASAIEKFSAQLQGDGIEGRPLHTSHAFHSQMMEPIKDAFVEQVRRVTCQNVTIPYISNLTGTWITNAEATDPSYWGRHLTQTVRFAEGAQTLLAQPVQLLLEVGPGTTLKSLMKLSSGSRNDLHIHSSLPHPKEKESDRAALLRTAGQCWLQGAPLDWSGFVQQGWRRVSLPTYPFERKKHWIAPYVPVSSPVIPNIQNGHSLLSDNFALLNGSKEENTYMSSHVLSETTPTRPAGKRRATIIGQIQEIFGSLLGIDPHTITTSQSFLEIGSDSLLLLQASQKLQERFGIKVPFRLLLEEYDTFDALAVHLDNALPEDALQEESSHSIKSVEVARPVLASAMAALSMVSPTPTNGTLSMTKPSIERVGIGGTLPAPLKAPVEHPETNSHSQDGMLQIFEQQLGILTQQLDILRQNSGAPGNFAPSQHVNPTADTAGSTAITMSGDVGLPVSKVEPTSNGHHNGKDETKSVLSLNIDPETFIPYKPRNVGRLQGLTQQQQEHLQRLLERYSRRTQRSKQFAQRTRAYHADNRGTAGFNLTFKEIVYPLVVDRAQGAHIVDVDKNEYVDITMGFGSLLYGHSPDFLVNALREHIDNGLRLGMQSAYAGEAARLLCELTGAERASFCNSGTEAVMTSLRLARAVTGRDKIAVFTGSFHGTFDGVLVRGQEKGENSLKPLPLAPGITPNLIGDVLLLNFGRPEALDSIRQHTHELAAVLVELPQSRRPDLVPVQFLQQLRALADEAGIALVFDEVVAGFRAHPGGAQALFGVQADIAAYGKALGGGLPVAAIAGKARYMNAVDGGVWSYGDDSYPGDIQTFFAGTYFKHPLVMPAVCAILTHLKQSGPSLQERLNERTAYLVQRLERCFKEAHVPVHPLHFSSLFRMIFPSAYKHIDANVFYYHLLENGVYISETRNGFLSTAHTDEDIEHIIWAVQKALQETQAGGFLQSK